MIFTQDFSDDFSAFGVFGGEMKAYLVHGEKNAAVNRFEAIADIGKSAGNDDAHSIIQITPLHFRSYFNRFYFTNWIIIHKNKKSDWVLFPDELNYKLGY